MANKSSEAYQPFLYQGQLICSSLVGKRNVIDPLFGRFIEMSQGMDDVELAKQLHASVTSIINSWCLLFVMWVSVVAINMYAMPKYVIDNGNSVITAIFKIASGFSTITALMALYSGVGLQISISALPHHAVQTFLVEMGSTLRSPFLYFSLSIVSFLCALGCSFWALSDDPMDPIKIALIICTGLGTMIAWNHHHLLQDKALLRTYGSHPKYEAINRQTDNI
jgi:hypothetical protein